MIRLRLYWISTLVLVTPNVTLFVLTLTAVTLLGFNIGWTCSFAKALISSTVCGGVACKFAHRAVTTVAFRTVTYAAKTKPNWIMPNNSKNSGTDTRANSTSDEPACRLLHILQPTYLRSLIS